jgi:hypothetical protein
LDGFGRETVVQKRSLICSSDNGTLIQKRKIMAVHNLFFKL